MEEIWKEIPGYEGMYEVSSIGNVRSLDRCVIRSGKRKVHLKGKLLYKIIDVSGYYKTTLTKDGTSRTWRIHVLMAMSFLGHNPCRFTRVIDHKDGIKTNNVISNIQVTTNRINTTKGRFLNKKSSKYLGVHKRYLKNGYSWFSCIQVNGKSIYLGTFDTDEEAHLCYINACNNALNGITVRRNINCPDYQPVK